CQFEQRSSAKRFAVCFGFFYSHISCSNNTRMTGEEQTARSLEFIIER
ncbi:MAG: hypothetical protein UX87_C0010G0001, partial [Candidatus Amesbacteria bacterium GW2011_GWA1_47_16]